MHVNFDLEVKHTSFMPQPKVDSAVVTLTPLTQKPDIDDYQFFDHVVKIAFAQRRKTLSNNLKTFISDKNEREQFITNLGLDLKVRPEELTLNQFVSLAKALKVR